MNSSFILHDKLLMASLLMERRLLVLLDLSISINKMFPTNEAHDCRRISTPSSDSFERFFLPDGFEEYHHKS